MKMKKILLTLIICFFTSAEAQIVSTFMETTSYGCYGLAINNNFLYVEIESVNWNMAMAMPIYKQEPCHTIGHQ